MTPELLKPKGIIFTGDMVRAILAGKKTQTRRLLNPQPKNRVVHVRGDEWLDADCINPGVPLKFRYGPVGRLLYVKETWLPLDPDHYDDTTLPRECMTRYGRVNGVAYRAATDTEGDRIRRDYGYRWRPSIHMPRWAARIWLRVTAIRAERLHEITEAGAIAEGLLAQRGGGPGSGYKWNGIGYHGAGFKGAEPTFHVPDDDGRCRCHVGGTTPAQCAFRELWNSIYGVRAPWSSNPWVGVYTFTPTTAP